jgi:hypothetical protein
MGQSIDLSPIPQAEGILRRPMPLLLKIVGNGLPYQSRVRVLLILRQPVEFPDLTFINVHESTHWICLI